MAREVKDVDILLAIIEDAYVLHGSPNSTFSDPPPLLTVLKAYERTLPTFGISATSDNVIYRLLLQVSLNQASSWYRKLEIELEKNGQEVDPRIRVRAAASVPSPPRAAPGSAASAPLPPPSSRAATAASPMVLAPAFSTPGMQGPPPPFPGYGGAGGPVAAAAPVMAGSLQPRPLPVPAAPYLDGGAAAGGGAHAHHPHQQGPPSAASSVVLPPDDVDRLRDWVASSGTPRFSVEPLPSVTPARTTGGARAAPPTVTVTSYHGGEASQSQGPLGSPAAAYSRTAAGGGAGVAASGYALASPLMPLPALEAAGPAASTLTGIAVTDFDPSSPRGKAYARKQRLARAFRRWVSTIVEWREARRLKEEALEVRLASALIVLDRCAQAAALRKWVAAWQDRLSEREGTVIAVEYWARTLLATAFSGWKRVIASSRPRPIYHPGAIRALFKWIAVTLPDHGQWWRLLEASSAAFSSAAAAGVPGSAAPGKSTVFVTTGRNASYIAAGGAPDDGAAASALRTRPSFGGFEYEAVARAAVVGPGAQTAAPGLMRTTARQAVAEDELPLSGTGTSAAWERSYLPASTVPASPAPPATPAGRGRAGGVWRSTVATMYGPRSPSADAPTLRRPRSGSRGRVPSSRGDSAPPVLIESDLPMSPTAIRGLKAGGYIAGGSRAAARAMAASGVRYGFEDAEGAGVEGVHLPSLAAGAGAGAGSLPAALVAGATSSAVGALAGDLVAAAKEREIRMGRLRHYVVSRIAPPVRKLPLLEHATALVDASNLLTMFTTWKTWTARQAHLRKRCRAMLLMRFVNAWAGAAASNRAIRVAELATQDLHARWTKARALAAWHVSLTDLLRERALSVKATRARFATLAGGVFARWVAFTARARLKKRRAALAADMERAVRIRRAFALWKRESRIVPLTRAMRRKACMRAAFREWVASVDAAKRTRKALGMWRNMAVSRCFMQWKRGLAIQAEEDELTSWEVRLLAVRKAWGAWRIAKRRVEVTRRVITRMKQIDMAKAFNAWAEGVARIKAERRLMTRVVTTMRLARALRAVTVWREWTADVLDAKRRNRTLEELQRKHAIAGALALWKAKFEMRNRMRKFLRHWRQAELARAVRTWRETVALREYNRLTVGKVLRRMQLRRLASAFDAMRSYADERKARRKTANHVIAVWERSAASRAVRQWLDNTRARTHAKRVAQRALNRMRMAVVARCFGSWAEVAHRRRQEREVMRNVVLTMQNRALAGAITRWRETTKESLHRRRVMMRFAKMMINSRLYSAVEHWREVTAHANSDRRKMEKVAAMMTSGALGRAVNTWRAFAKAQRSERRTLRECAARIAGGKASSAIASWRAWAAERRRGRALIARVIYRMRMMHVATAFSRMQEYTAQRKAQKKLMADVADILISSKLVAAVRHWKSQASQRRYNREVMTRVATRIMQRSTAAAFETWFDLFQERREHRAAAEAFAAARRAALVKAVFDGWAKHTTHFKRYRRTHRLSVWFTLWRTKIARSKSLRLRHEAVTALVRTNTARSHLGAWKTGLAIAAHRERATLRSGWRRWRASMARNDALRRLAAIHTRKFTAAWLHAWADRATEHRLYWEGVARVKASLDAAAFVARGTGRPHLSPPAIVWRWTHQPAAKAFNAIAEYVGVRRVKAALAARADEHADYMVARAAFATWTAAFRASRRAAAAAQFARHTLLARGFSLLHRATVIRRITKAEKAAKAARADAHLAAKLTAKAWAGMRRVIAGRAARAAVVDERVWAAEDALLASSFASWRHMAKMRRKLRHVIGNFMDSMLEARTRNALARWRDTAKKNHWMRKSAISFMMATAERRCWTQWCRYVAHCKAKRAAKARALALRVAFVRRNVAAVFDAWAAWTAKQRSRKDTVRKALLRIRQASVARAFAGWTDFVARRKHERRVMLGVITHMQLVQQGRAVAQWRRITDVRRRHNATLARADRFARKCALKASWATLRAEYAKRLRAKAVMARFIDAAYTRHLRAAWASWKEHVATENRLAAAAVKAVASFRNLLAARAFRSWTAYVAARRRDRATMSRVVATMRNISLHQAVLTWYDNVAARRAARRKVQRAFARHMGINLRIAFEGWRDNVAHVRRVRALGTQFIEDKEVDAAQKALRAWKAALDGVAAEKKAVAWARKQTLARIFGAWQHNAHVLRVSREVLTRWQNRALIQSLEAWRSVTALSKATRFAFAHDMHIVRRAFMAMADHARQRASLRATQEVATEALARRSAGLALRKWRRYARISAAVAEREAIYHAALSAQAFEALKAYRVYRKDKRVRTVAARAVVMSGMLARVFSGWREVVVDAQVYRHSLATEHALKVRLDRRLARARMHALATAFAAWRKKVAVTRAAKELAVRFTLKTAGAAALVRWRAAVARRRRLVAAEAAIVAARADATAARALAAWRSAAVASRRRRRGATALVDAVASASRASLLARAWKGWKADVSAARYERRATARADAFHARWALSRVFAAWKGQSYRGRHGKDPRRALYSPQKAGAAQHPALTAPVMVGAAAAAAPPSPTRVAAPAIAAQLHSSLRRKHGGLLAARRSGAVIPEAAPLPEVDPELLAASARTAQLRRAAAAAVWEEEDGGDAYLASSGSEAGSPMPLRASRRFTALDSDEEEEAALMSTTRRGRMAAAAAAAAAPATPVAPRLAPTAMAAAAAALSGTKRPRPAEPAPAAAAAPTATIGIYVPEENRVIAASVRSPGSPHGAVSRPTVVLPAGTPLSVRRFLSPGAARTGEGAAVVRSTSAALKAKREAAHVAETATPVSLPPARPASTSTSSQPVAPPSPMPAPQNRLPRRAVSPEPVLSIAAPKAHRSAAPSPKLEAAAAAIAASPAMTASRASSSAAMPPLPSLAALSNLQAGGEPNAAPAPTGVFANGIISLLRRPPVLK